MKDNTKVFAEYPVPKAVMTMALPSMLGMLINIIYNLADTFFVGQTGDSNQVAAVSVSMPVFLFALSIGNLFGVGGCAFISRSLGEGRTDRVKQISSFCVYASIICGIVLGALFFAFRRPILYLVGASDYTIDFACDYLMWIALGSPFVVVSIMACNIIRGEGSAKDSMLGMVIGQLVNIVLDPIFILSKGDMLFGFKLPFGLSMGVAGAAVATILGNIVSVLYFLIYFLKGKSMLSITPRRFTLKNGIPGGVISVGLPAALNNLLMSISNILINIVLSGYGDVPVAAMGIAMKANMLVVMLQLGLAQGMQPIVGYCFGARNYERMKKVMRFSALCNVLIGSVMTAFYVLFKQNVIELFIENDEVIEIGVKMLVALMSAGPLIGIMFVLNFSFQGMGMGKQSLLLSAGRQGLVYIPLLFILNRLVGLEGVIWAQPCADFMCIIMAFLMWTVIKRKLKNENK
ncbi:MAG: MATE family efflux transporter [Eubacterium sp.]|nr:MATE family efflux transporter [Eubacterium sp.]